MTIDINAKINEKTNRTHFFTNKMQRNKKKPNNFILFNFL